MKIMKIQGVIAAVLLCLCSVTSWADELTNRVDFVSKQLGCEFPYLVAEDSETGRFYAETKLKNPQRLKIQGFPDAPVGMKRSMSDFCSGKSSAIMTARNGRTSSTHVS